MTDECKTVVARDGCVVESESLAQVLGPFIASWTRERPPTGGRYVGSETVRDERLAMTASGWLAEKTQLSERTIEGIVSRDDETGAWKSRTKYTELRVADALVSAIGRPDYLSDGDTTRGNLGGTLEIKPNQAAKRAAQRECCGGSEPG